MNKLVDIEYDFRTDANGGDVDRCSATLRKYHKILWSKNLPNGKYFDLLDTVDEYLFFQNDNQGIRLSSDWIVNTYSHLTSFNFLFKQIKKEEIDNFDNVAHTIGGYIIFPKNPVNALGKLSTVNTERGKYNGKIADRFDLTLECIRRYYINEVSPLKETLNRFDNYFEMFVNFQKFCDFFYLQDMTLDNYSKIKYFLPFDDFEINPYPKTVEKYLTYKENAIEFNKSRNKRIQDYVNSVSR
jgi:hypothetical protein